MDRPRCGAAFALGVVLALPPLDARADEPPLPALPAATPTAAATPPVAPLPVSATPLASPVVPLPVSITPRFTYATPPAPGAAGSTPAAVAPTPPRLQLTQPGAPRGRGAWRSFRAGADLMHSVPIAAIIDGAWSISTHINTELTNRTWSKPYPTGSIGQYSTRILYGVSWTLMLGLESLVVVLANHGKFDWLSEAAYRSDWILPLDLPACPRPGAWGGCGLGVGTFSFIQIRPRATRWWYEAGGGWIQQRVFNDALRTVAESSWVLTPLSAVREFKTDPADDVAFRAFVGPGVYFGMHNAHMHPTRRGREVYSNVPWNQMYPLDAGIGPGARAEGRMIIKRHLSFEAEVVFAPFLLGGPTKRASRDVAPLDFEREGWSVWRKVSAGIGWDDPRNMPFKATIGVFGAELSERPIERIGHRGVMLRFDIPLRLPSSRED